MSWDDYDDSDHGYHCDKCGHVPTRRELDQGTCWPCFYAKRDAQRMEAVKLAVVAVNKTDGNYPDAAEAWDAVFSSAKYGWASTLLPDEGYSNDPKVLREGWEKAARERIANLRRNELRAKLKALGGAKL